MPKLDDKIFEHSEYAGLVALKGVELPDLVVVGVELGVRKIDANFLADLSDPKKLARLEELSYAIYNHKDGHVISKRTGLPLYLTPFFDSYEREGSILKISQEEYNWFVKRIGAGEEIDFSRTSIKNACAVDSFSQSESELYKAGNWRKVPPPYVASPPDEYEISGIIAIDKNPVAREWALSLFKNNKMSAESIFCGSGKRFIELANNPKARAKIESLLDKPKLIECDRSWNGFFTDANSYAREPIEFRFFVEEIIENPEMESVFDALSKNKITSALINLSHILVESWKDEVTRKWLIDLKDRGLLAKSPVFSAGEMLNQPYKGWLVNFANAPKAVELSEKFAEEPELYRKGSGQSGFFGNYHSVSELLEQYSPDQIIEYLRAKPQEDITILLEDKQRVALKEFCYPTPPAPKIQAGKAVEAIMQELKVKFGN